MFPSATSTQVLSTSRGDDSTTALDNLFQCSTNIYEKKFFLISSSNLPWHNLRPFPFLLLPAMITLFWGKVFRKENFHQGCVGKVSSGAFTWGHTSSRRQAQKKMEFLAEDTPVQLSMTPAQVTQSQTVKCIQKQPTAPVLKSDWFNTSHTLLPKAPMIT